MIGCGKASLWCWEVSEKMNIGWITVKTAVSVLLYALGPLALTHPDKWPLALGCLCKRKVTS